MLKFLTRLALAKKAWDWYTDYKRKKSQDQPTRKNGYWD